MTEQSLHVLLIGVDCYMPNELPDGNYYPHLGGCVRDVEHVEAFLKNRLSVPDGRITKLTASGSGEEPGEAMEVWPTYENMVGAFQELTQTARAGDLVYVHYAGHGGRASTVYPEAKSADGLDEALVPTDIGSEEARYLRDIELAMLVKRMVEKDLLVTVVLDSCHSGGMTRGSGGAAVRGIGTIDQRPLRTDSLVAEHEELVSLWKDATATATRDASAGAGWLPEPKGYTLLAACRQNESAFEDVFEGGEKNGALTYWMLDSLRDIGPGLSYKVLHDRIVAKVHSQFEEQTPQLQGEGDLAVFGRDRVKPYYAALVMSSDPTKGVLINAGQAHAVSKGAQFVVFPHGRTDFERPENRIALVEVTDLGATESWATVIEHYKDDAIEQGAQAVLTGAGKVRLVRKVGLVQRDDLAGDVDQTAALAAVEKAIAQAGWVELATDGEPLEFQVVVNEAGNYEVWDSAGAAIPRLQPPLDARGEGSVTKLVARLEHLSKYNALRQLSNHDPMSPLANKLQAVLTGWAEDHEPGDRFVGQPFDDAGNTPVLKVGQWTALRICNNSQRALNVSVLDLQPAWGAKQIWPADADSFRTLDAGQEETIPLKASLPEAYKDGTDVIKVFATVGTTSFRWLELPPLDEPCATTRSADSRGPQDELEELFAAFGADRPATRDLTPHAQPSTEWTTAQVELRVSRG